MILCLSREQKSEQKLEVPRTTSMQWAAIFHKHDVRITEGIDHLNFYNSELDKHERILPCKVSCALCGTLIADEGRNMWLAFPSLFNFGGVSKVPTKFKPTCHIFYGMRVIDINDDLPKWSGHKNHSELLGNCGLPGRGYN